MGRTSCTCGEIDWRKQENRIQKEKVAELRCINVAFVGRCEIQSMREVQSRGKLNQRLFSFVVLKGRGGGTESDHFPGGYVLMREE